MSLAPVDRALEDPPLVSVIVPCYQAERIIIGAVRSILAQTYRRLEVFVVDDGSTDGTQARLATIADPRVTVLRQANGGAARARNLALARCTGTYIAFLDADDRWFPEKIATELAVLRARPDPVGIAYSWFYAVDDAGRYLNGSPAVRLEGMIFDRLIASENFLIPSVSLYHRGVFDAIGTFDAQHFHEDFEFALRAAHAFPVYPTGRRLAVYRQSLTGKCRSILSDFDRSYREEMSIVESIAPLLDDEQRRVFRTNQVRSLLYRFLMYGFSRSARALVRELGDAELPGRKGTLARLFVRSGINALAPARAFVQTFNRLALQGPWRRSLRQRGLALLYE